MAVSISVNSTECTCGHNKTKLYVYLNEKTLNIICRDHQGKQVLLDQADREEKGVILVHRELWDLQA